MRSCFSIVPIVKLKTMISEIEQARLSQLKDQIQSGQRSEDPRLEFARRLRDRLLKEEFEVLDQAEGDSATIKAAQAHLEQAKSEIPLREQAEDIRARIEARARGDSRAARAIIKDRAEGQVVTRLGMRMEVEGKSEKETINVGMVAGTGDGEEDGTVSISYLIIKQDGLGHPVETQQIKAKILRGGEFSIRKGVGYFGELRNKSEDYSVVYPRPDRPEFGGETKVLDEGQAKIHLGMLEFLVDRCLTQPNSSFYRQKDISRRVLSE